MEKDVYAFVGKSHYETEEYWLPLWMHHKDTAGIMKKLVGSWVPESVIDAAGLKYKTFRKIAVFLAALHDIGKAASFRIWLQNLSRKRKVLWKLWDFAFPEPVMQKERRRMHRRDNGFC